MRVASCKLRVNFETCELQTASCELQNVSWNLRVENCELRVSHICELKNMIFTGE